MSLIRSICIDASGPGLIFYSPFSVASIRDGEDYLEIGFSDPDEVEKQALAGSLVGVSTGTSGRFHLKLFNGYPTDSEVASTQFKLRLGVEVRDRTLCIRELFDLLSWQSQCPESQIVDLDDGFYHVTLMSSEPPSGILGEDQVIRIYLQQTPEMPKLKYNGVPTLC